MTIVEILKTPDLTVTSHGNGWGYAVNFGSAQNPPMRTLWFQDDDATRLREEVEGIEAASPDMSMAEAWLRALDPYLD